jgi:hypothetical protein
MVRQAKNVNVFKNKDDFISCINKNSLDFKNNYAVNIHAFSTRAFRTVDIELHSINSEIKFNLNNVCTEETNLLCFQTPFNWRRTRSHPVAVLLFDHFVLG